MFYNTPPGSNNRSSSSALIKTGIVFNPSWIFPPGETLYMSMAHEAQARHVELKTRNKIPRH